VERHVFPRRKKVSSGSVSGGAGSRRPLVIALVIVGVIALIVAILWFAGAAPSFLNAGSHVKGHGNHVYRGAVGAVVGIAALIGAWLVNKRSR
jgi:hypothetical protein